MNKSTKQKLIITTLSLVLLVFPSVTFALDGVEKLVYSFVSSVFGWFMGMSGWLLNITINKYVIGFGDEFFSGNLDTTVSALWVSVRDIFNMTFIFGLIYIGFKMILDSDDSDTRRWLVYLLIAALLVNFSLYFTKVIIDASNLLATEIAQNGFLLDNEGEGGVMVSETFADILNLSSSVDSAGENGWTFIFGSLVIYIVGTFVFLTGAIMLFVRFAVLILYMILSPVMFLGWVFPQLKSYTSKYWRGFFGQAFFAPVYLLMLYISAKVLTTFTDVDQNLAGVFSAQNGAEAKDSIESTLAPFIIGVIFLIASVIISKSLSDAGASSVLGVGKRASNFSNRLVRQRIVGGSIGVAGAVGRNTAGRGANKLVNNNKFKSFASNNKGYGKFLGKPVFQGTQKIAGASFDARNTSALKKQNLGTAQRGGFAKTVEDKKKADEKFMKDIHVNYNENSAEFIQKIAEKQVEITKELNDKKTEQQTKLSSVSTEKQKEVDAINSNTKLSTEDKTKALAEIDSKYSAMSASINQNIASLDNSLKNVNDRAKSAVKYENELNYIKKLEGSAFRKNAEGTLPFINWTVSASLPERDRINASISNLKRQYGENGEEAVKREKQKKQAKLRQEVDKELLAGDSGPEEKKDEDNKA